MFDWKEDGAADAIWGEFGEGDDHIVPYPKVGDNDSSLTYGNCSKKQHNQGTTTSIRSTQLISGVTNDFPGCDVGNCSGGNTTEEFSAPILDMDSWPDLSSLSATLSKGYTDQTNQDSSQTQSFDEILDAANRKKGRVQLEGEGEFFDNVHEDRQGNSFLDCDWANIGDFDDLDKLLSSNDSMFGNDIGSNADEFLSGENPFSGTGQSITVPDISHSLGNSFDQEYFPYHCNKYSDGRRISEQKLADVIGKTEERTTQQGHLTVQSSGRHGQSSGKLNMQPKGLKSKRRTDGTSKNSSLQNLKGSRSSNNGQSKQLASARMPSCPSTSLQTFQYPAISQQKQVGGSEHFGCPSSSNHFIFTAYGQHAYTFPSVPSHPHAPDERNYERPPVAPGCKSNLDPANPTNNLEKLPDILKPLTMTPQEKIEKLRRRQQVQAMIAIQQQHQQFGKQISGFNSLVSQACSSKDQNQDATSSTTGVEDTENKLRPLEMSMLFQQDESNRISMAIDDQSLEETIFHRLQDVLRKLDTRERLYIRDSLFRLAKSAMKRQGASHSSINYTNNDEPAIPANVEANNQDRFSSLSDVETSTNHLDRIVAHLLFYGPPELQ